MNAAATLNADELTIVFTEVKDAKQCMKQCFKDLRGYSDMPAQADTEEALYDNFEKFKALICNLRASLELPPLPETMWLAWLAFEEADKS